MECKTLRLLAFSSLMLLWPAVPAAAADLPTAEEILKIHRANKERLAHLHLQLTHAEETTDAWAGNNLKAAARMEADIRRYRADPKAFTAFDADGKPIDEAERKRMLEYQLAPERKKEIEQLRKQATPFELTEVWEIFLNGDDYQFRIPTKPYLSAAEVADWSFPTAAVTAESLPTTFAQVGIMSFSAATHPSLRRWVDARHMAYVSNQPLGPTWRVS
jgi:hypothetical protein